MTDLPDRQEPNDESNDEGVEGEVVSEEEAQAILASYSSVSPIPPPSWMERYDQIVPGSARQMMDDMHAQSAHRREIERQESRAEVSLAQRGQLFGFVTACAGFVVVMIGMIGGLALAYAGISLGGGIALVLLSLACIASVFVANRFAARPPHQDIPPDDPVKVRQQPPTPNSS